MVPARVVARVKVPPTRVFDIVRAINDNLSAYDAALSPVRRPGDDQPLPFPEGFVQNGDDEDEETP